MDMEDFSSQAAVLIARLFLGTLFLLQGYDKIFKTGLRNVIPVYKQELVRSGLPAFMINGAAYYTSWSELLGGLLLILGLFKGFALYALGVDLVLVAVAMGLIEPLWRMDYVFPRLALLLFLLFAPGRDCFSIDHFLFR